MPALQSGCYKITWENCEDLPSPMCRASAVLHNEKVHVMAGVAPDDDTYRLYLVMTFPPITGIDSHPLDMLMVYCK